MHLLHVYVHVYDAGGVQGRGIWDFRLRIRGVWGIITQLENTCGIHRDIRSKGSVILHIYQSPARVRVVPLRVRVVPLPLRVRVRYFLPTRVRVRVRVQIKYQG